ncbi:DUF4440 domain-containing protein [Nocardia gipuzkoensis]|uniref:nuclear transport factor 2 family protein n=1 Tax=Nocardia gipuzkoensis TaxID=2749991 RepID=UPI00237DD12D|nr:DUF4440 domain-containing protein [Nocardia gipuzkoensis]MDE1674761.1 DUF4440 domain-containing protein [Nocardia gipuzkoensis]
MSFTSDDPDIEYVISAELQLLDRAIRNSRVASSALLDPEFREFGASGKVWDRESILDMMSEDTSSPPTIDDLMAAHLGPNVILLTYRTRSPERTAVRSSIWLHHENGWKLYFHQGTAQPQDIDAPSPRPTTDRRPGPR